MQLLTTEKRQEKAKAIATGMLKHGKTFSETYDHIQKVFTVNVQNVMESAVNEYRTLFI